jgi:hypothetical protein
MPSWTFSLMHRVHFFFFTPTSNLDPPMLLMSYQVDDVFDTL